MERTVLCGMLLMSLPWQAFAQTTVVAPYPSRAVRLITPVTSGGTADFVARAVAKKLAEAWGQPVVVDPRPGAGMIIATDLGAKAPADGYPLLMVPPSFTANPSLLPKFPYAPLRDFPPETLTSLIPSDPAFHPPLPVRTVREAVL